MIEIERLVSYDEKRGLGRFGLFWFHRIQTHKEHPNKPFFFVYIDEKWVVFIYVQNFRWVRLLHWGDRAVTMWKMKLRNIWPFSEKENLDNNFGCPLNVSITARTSHKRTNALKQMWCHGEMQGKYSFNSRSITQLFSPIPFDWALDYPL